ncbi:hypothetical protein [Methylobacterium sp. R2-1]|uniref:hypothetical protein n=1 Tax=Methylobacterium sp. R2-1 TaxID=2587064 RepID=UPI00161F2734|nr:hypothetical protein [Methylobacterium sp. R2-1]MBB2961472.1 hypothetical protein [Methylobacterium sp. R2-1]
MRLPLGLRLRLTLRHVSGWCRAGRRKGAEQAGKRDREQRDGPHTILNLVAPAVGGRETSERPDGKRSHG